MKKLVTALVVAVLLAGTVSLGLWWQLRTERERAEELAARAAPPMTEMAEVLVQPVAPSFPATDSGPASTTSAPPRDAPPGAASTAADPVGRQPGPTQRAADPMAGMMEVMIRQSYPDVAEELGLTDAEASEFLSLFMRLQSETGTQFMDLMTGGTMEAGRRQQRQLQMLEKERADEAALRRHLGNKYPRWEEYQSNAEARATVNELRTSLATIGNPLTDQQADALVTVFASDASRAREEEQAWLQSDAARSSSNLMVERLQRQFDRQKRWVDLAAPRMDAGQLDHFRSTIEQQSAMVNAMMGMMGGGK